MNLRTHPQYRTFVFLLRNPDPSYLPRPLSGSTLSDRVSGPGTWERAAAVLVKAADSEPQQQQEQDLEKTFL